MLGAHQKSINKKKNESFCKILILASENINATGGQGIKLAFKKVYTFVIIKYSSPLERYNETTLSSLGGN